MHCGKLAFRLACLLLCLLRLAHADEFTQDVAPILAERCLSCHNQLDKKGDFSLQTRDALLDSGYVEPGAPDDSHLLTVITAQGGKRPGMPKNGDPLTEQEVAAIRQWIAAGSVWPEDFQLRQPAVRNFDWWSLQPLAQADVPHFEGNAAAQQWIRTPIDAFVLEKLAAQGLAPSPEADRRTLIRRLTFDLLGLPPTPAEIQAFVDDPDPQAYEKLVDRLLDSKHYGERWARHWLDVVKYADTCGYDKDKLRPNAWPYRDYVIRSFNEDKPYARFVQEQIAGDVLFPGTADGILGLGFIAAGPWDFIGHVEVPESKLDGKVARNLDRDEMVSNTLNTFCSVTIQCARCHNHKFDPFTQQHYYQLQSVFAAVDRAERPYDTDPTIEDRRRDLAARHEELVRQQKQLSEEIAAAGGSELSELEKRVRDLQARTKVASKRPEFGYHSGIEKSQDVIKWVQVDLGAEIEIDQVVLHPCHDDYAGIGSGFGFPVRFRVEAATEESFAVTTLLADETERDLANPGLAPYRIERPVSARYVRVTATALAPRSNDFIFALSELEVFAGDSNNVALRKVVTSHDSIEAAPRWRRSNLVDGIWPAAQDPQALVELAEATRRRDTLLDDVMTPQRLAKQQELAEQLKTVNEQRAALPPGSMVYAAATEFSPQGNFKPTKGEPREIHVLHRGNIDQPREAVSPGTIPLRPDDRDLFELPADHAEGARRAALAQWLTRPDHPLTWRSIVNRVWQYHFSQGLVGSPNDFGRMGRLPTHPELLDWLAVEFRDNGQSMKQLHRLMVTSAVYRQVSDDNAAAASIDGSNQYLWRMNRRRLEAEEVRDAILAISGKLNTEMGGPGYYLFVLEKTAHSPHFEYHKFDPNDSRSHRRSIYRFIARSQPDPFMSTLDCADSSQSTPLRDETLTSLQALSLLNNRFNLVMAQHFADRLQSERATLPEQIERAMWLVAGRTPTASEQQRLEDYASQHGLANACRLLWNLSEFVYLD